MIQSVSRQSLEENDEWTCTDPDTDQWVRQVEPMVFKVIEGEVDYADTYDLSQMSLGEMEELVTDYYPSLGAFFSYAGDNWDMLLAEMVSEREAPVRTH